MKLFIEQVEDVQFLNEEVNGVKKLFVEGIFLQSEIKNRNGRVYPKRIMENAVQRYMKESVARKNAYGELGHPEGPTINPDRISHLITNLKEDGNNYIGKAKVLDTPLGNIAKTLIGEGSLAVSSRGLGSLRNIGGQMQVQEDFMLATAADFVINPSAPDAFVDGIMEGHEWICDPISGTWHIDAIRRDINEAARTKTLNEQAVLKAWAKLMRAF